MELQHTLCCLLVAVLVPSVQNVAVTTPPHHTQPIGQDHLLIVLQGMHHSDTFHHLPTNYKLMLVELLAAAEVDAVTHYIDTVGFDKFLLLVDAITKINATEAHMFEHYMIQELNQENPDGAGQSAIGRKRSLTDFLNKVHQNPAVQALSADEQALLDELLRAAQSHTLTPIIHREGYAKIIQLIEDISTQSDTHLFISYLVETAEDLGGPRKEFFQLVLSEIKRKYFDSGLREHLAKDYLTVGKIMSLSVLQNGKLPKFMDPAILEDVFRDEDGSSDCIKNLRKGLNCLGLVKIGSVFPIFVHLFRPSQTTLTLKAVIQILKPVFSEEGSNSRQLENSVYSAYLKYLRAVASGRRGSVSLHHILQFATGTPEEPILGFTLQPSIHFFEVKSSSGFIPTANTCINNMKLPRPSYEIALPSEEELFALYDYAFLNTFYGLF